MLIQLFALNNETTINQCNHIMVAINGDAEVEDGIWKLKLVLKTKLD